MVRPIVILFARAPRLGCVKRRLAAGVGEVSALRFYRNQLGRMARELQTFDAVLSLTPDGVRFRPAPEMPVIGQGHGDLGTRMTRAFKKFRRRTVILVGADIPGLNTGILRQAVFALQAHDAVFGPAADGGYYLVGMSIRRPAAPFADVRWSSEYALTDTLENFHRRHRIALLSPLADVDTSENFENHAIIRHCGAAPKPTTLGVVVESVSYPNV